MEARVLVNAGFLRRVPGTRKRYEWRNVTGMRFDSFPTQAAEVRAHPRAQELCPAAAGWVLQGWALATPKTL